MKKNLYSKQLVLLVCLLTGSNACAMMGKKGWMGLLKKGVTAIQNADFSGVANTLDNLANSEIAKGIGNGVKKIGNTFDEMARKAADAKLQAQRLHNQQQQEKLRQIAALNDRLTDRHTTEAEKLLIHQQLAAHQREIEAANDALRRSNERWDILQNKVSGLGAEFLDMGKNMVIEQQKAYNAERIASIQGHHQKLATIGAARETAQAYTRFFAEKPHYIVGIAGGIFATWHGTKLATKVIQDQYEIPELADRDKTSLLSLPQKFYNWVTGTKPPAAKLGNAIFEPKLAERIGEITGSLQNIVANGGVLPNILLWGPPGTGKTLVAMLMARSCGMEYIYFSASSLENYSVEIGMNLLTQLFRYAGDCPKRLMIIIDEAEAVLADRGRANLSDKAKKFLTHILTYTGTESSKYCVVALTNRPQDLDEAFRSRCDHMIQVDAPAYGQVLDMIKLYINTYLIEASDLHPPKPSIFTRMFSKPVELKKVRIEEGALSDDVIEAMAQALTDNAFVGRDISKLILKVRSSAYATKDFIITSDMVQHVVDTTITEKRAEREGYKRNSQRVAAAAA